MSWTRTKKARSRKMNSKVYKQGNSKWASKPYPTRKSSFGGHGCGCVSCVHIAIEQASKWNWTPESLRPYMVKKGYAVAGHGTTWQGIYNTLKYLGHKNVVWVKRGEPMSKAFKELDKGNRMCIFLFNSNLSPSKVRWTKGGHYVAAVQYKKDKNGNHLFYCKDSGGRNHTGWFSYERDMRSCVSQVWVCEKINTPKPYKITKPYTGKLPSKVVRKGSKGADVKALQTFLNWAVGSKLAVDGKAGNNTISILKKWQGKAGLSKDGVFGGKSRAKAKEWVAKYAK